MSAAAPTDFATRGDRRSPHLFAVLVLLVLAGLVGPVLANGRRPLVPVVVGELIGGVIVGRTGLAILDPNAGAMPAFYGLGFGMLMVTAGQHVDLASADFRASLGRGVRLFVLVALVSIPIGAVIAVAAGSSVPVGLLVVLLAGSSAAIVVPILEEHGLAGPSITTLTGWIALADGLTVVLMPLTLTGADHLAGAIAGDVAIGLVAAAFWVLIVRIEARPRIGEVVERSRSRGWALQLRLSILGLVILGAIAEATGGSLLVAGFAAGIVLARVARSDRLALQLAAVANGLFIPAFFVLLGATLDVRALASSPAAIGLAVLLAIGAVLVHLVAARIAAPEERIPMGLAASAQLGLPAAAAALGIQSGHLEPAIAAALVAAGCLTLVPAAIGGDLLAAHLGNRP